MGGSLTVNLFSNTLYGAFFVRRPSYPTPSMGANRAAILLSNTLYGRT